MRTASPGTALHYIDLSAPGGATVLHNGASTVTRTLTLSESVPEQHLNSIRSSLSLLPPNVPPASAHTGGRATNGQTYTYASHAVDPDGVQIKYLLTAGPQGAAINSSTGALSWTPGARDGANVFFEIRAYDSRGGFAQQDWLVTLTGGNLAPVIAPITTKTITKGSN